VNATSGMADSRAAVRPNMLVRTAILAFLWWLIAQGQTNAWLIGLPTVALAAMASVYLGRATSPEISLAGLSGFMVLFLRESVRGGIDVARRTLAPRLRIRPGFKTYRMQLTDPSARVLLVNCLSLCVVNSQLSPKTASLDWLSKARCQFNSLPHKTGETDSIGQMIDSAEL